MKGTDWADDIHCDSCGKYLFTEGEVNGKWKFIRTPKIGYTFYPNSNQFICEFCDKKDDECEESL